MCDQHGECDVPEPAPLTFTRLSTQLRYTVKKVNDFPVPSRDVTYQTLPGREKFTYSRPVRVW